LDPEPLDPERVLRQRCVRHRVPAEAGARLLPLVRRRSAGEARRARRLLRIVDAVLAADAERISRRKPAPSGAPRAGREVDGRHAVAALLHRWGGEQRDGG
jgi:hypothetical protein